MTKYTDIFPPISPDFSHVFSPAHTRQHPPHPPCMASHSPHNVGPRVPNAACADGSAGSGGSHRDRSPHTSSSLSPTILSPAATTTASPPSPADPVASQPPTPSSGPPPGAAQPRPASASSFGRVPASSSQLTLGSSLNPPCCCSSSTPAQAGVCGKHPHGVEDAYADCGEGKARPGQPMASGSASEGGACNGKDDDYDDDASNVKKGIFASCCCVALAAVFGFCFCCRGN